MMKGSKTLMKVFSGFLFFYPLSSFATQTVIFSEVFYDAPSPESKKEWLEIYNASATIIDIGNYTIKDNHGTYTISTGTLISPGQVLIFARSQSGFYDMFHFNPDFADLNLSLYNKGDWLYLYDASGIQLDMVAWEGGISGWNLEADEWESIKRKALPTAPASWLSHQTPDPGSPAPIPEPGTLLLFFTGTLLFFAPFRKKSL